jgi:ubiquinone/menaquinone biosynthesis C-methylase UbiE
VVFVKTNILTHFEATKLNHKTFFAALDAGCGPGRTALEFSSVFRQVEAYDYSQGFVDMMLKEMHARGIKNLSAFQGDSHKQEEICSIKKFDLIHGCNLIDRLHTPSTWVRQSKVNCKNII